MKNEIEVLEQPVKVAAKERKVILSLPCGVAAGERRFPLTPEGAAQLTERGIIVKMQRGAGEPIHYSDAAYQKAGVDICERAEALRGDIVVTVAPLLPAEARGLRRGAMLLTLYHSVLDHPEYAKALQHAGVNVVASDLISYDGHRIVADILHEIDGCASLSIASSLLADPINGKGILLGGVTGLVPCEVTVIGSGMGAIAAAHNALGLGATVRMFDDDLYSLRSASRVLDHRCIASAMHPKTFRTALRTADVVVVTPTAHPIVVHSDVVEEMKQRVLIFDLTNNPGSTFASVKLVDAGSQVGMPALRVCYYNLGNCVPRTAAMALSNALVANIPTLTEATGELAQIPAAIRPALLYFWGKCVNNAVGEATGVRAMDINLML